MPLKRLSFLLPVLAILTLLASCSSRDGLLDYALENSGDNRRELEATLRHYADNALKREAAEWLIANMPGHGTEWSEGIQEFADSIMHHSRPPLQADSLWDSISSHSPTPQRQLDLNTLPSRFLIENIDGAFDAWLKAPWKDEVDFDRFKRFVLPYRADSELLRNGWRDSLRHIYAPIVAEATTAREAFERVCRTVGSVKRNGKYRFPYLMDACALNNHRSSICIERCVHLAAVCRALGLPVVIDNCGKWANYSDNTHTWVALVLSDGTYTVIDDDSIARKDNPIDASTFRLERQIPDWYPYTAEFRKRPVKIWRQTYEINPVESIPAFDEGSGRLSCARLLDVSHHYGLTASVDIPLSRADITDVWLCSHALRTGWTAQAHAKVTDSALARFENIADSVMLLPMGIDKQGAKVILGAPFYISKGRKIEVNTNPKQLQSATLTRKYPINAKWLTRYAQIPGTRIEASNDSLFLSPVTLHTISRTPLFHNTVTINPSRSYRYIRVAASPPSYTNMERLDIYSPQGILLLRGKAPVIDLGQSRRVERIDFFPWNDGNFIVPGHEYELAFWDCDRWLTIDRRISNGYDIRFDRIPRGALLILRDLTEGIEERPFTLHNGKQIWW